MHFGRTWVIHPWPWLWGAWWSLWLSLAQSQSPSATEPLREIAPIRRLTEAEAKQGRPAKLEAVVTYHDAEWGMLFVQDQTGGIYVVPEGLKLSLRPGDRVELQGVVAPGSFVPIVRAHQLRQTGAGPEPSPKPCTADELVRGGLDSQWIELRAVVRSANEDSGRLFLSLAAGDHQIPLVLRTCPPGSAAGLVDSLVRARGVCTMTLNDDFKPAGARLFAEDLNSVTVEKSAAADPFAVPLQTLNRIRDFVRAGEETHRIRVQATVSLVDPPWVFAVDSATAVVVETSQAESLEPGDRVDIVGFPTAAGAVQPRLRDALARRVGREDLPTPIEVSGPRLRDATQDGRLVRTIARWVKLESDGTHQRAEVEIDGRILQVTLRKQPGAALLNDLPTGSTVRLTGIASMDDTVQPLKVRLRLRSAADVVFLRGPPWWSSPVFVYLLAVLVVGVIAVLGWVAALKRRVREQALIQRQQAREALLERRYRELVENANDLIYEHDLAGVILEVNQAAQRITGYSRENLRGLTLGQLVSPVSKAALAGLLETVRRGQPFPPREIVVVRADGQEAVLECSAWPTPGPEATKRVQAIARDVTERKRAAEQLEEMNRRLVVTSREAGMAEIATNVLHNVGNVLNSVNVSLTVVREQLRESRLPRLTQALQMLKEHQDQLATFLSEDPKGRLLPAFLALTTESLQEEQAIMTSELGLLDQNLGHIKDIVARQQSYAKLVAVRESYSLSELLEEALRIHEAAWTETQVRVERCIEDTPPFIVDKHRVLQILVNLLQNARWALQQSGRTDKVLKVALGRTDKASVRIAVTDNGIGIPPENLEQIFRHGFTTREGGHGFGLHSSAIAAHQMGGSLEVHSEGPGTGATFVLELPMTSF